MIYLSFGSCRKSFLKSLLPNRRKKVLSLSISYLYLSKRFLFIYLFVQLLLCSLSHTNTNVIMYICAYVCIYMCIMYSHRLNFIFILVPGANPLLVLRSCHRMGVRDHSFNIFIFAFPKSQTMFSSIADPYNFNWFVVLPQTILFHLWKPGMW